MRTLNNSKPMQSAVYAIVLYAIALAVYGVISMPVKADTQTYIKLIDKAEYSLTLTVNGELSIADYNLTRDDCNSALPLLPKSMPTNKPGIETELHWDCKAQLTHRNN